jgi:hypothetical protein
VARVRNDDSTIIRDVEAPHAFSAMSVLLGPANLAGWWLSRFAAAASLSIDHRGW